MNFPGNADYELSAWCDGLAAIAGLRIEPLTRADVDEARALRGLRDPHDRLIGGTSLRLGAGLLTADRRMRSERRLHTPCAPVVAVGDHADEVPL